jgi:UDP-N-acetylglucosamine 1-carboxyvinyltransferase
LYYHHEQLEGTVKIEGAKNAVLPILAATLLAEEGVTTLKNVPILSFKVVTPSSAKRVAAKIGKTAFLAPSIFTVPSNFVLPHVFTMNQVIKHLNVAIDFDEDANEVTIDATQPLGTITSQ